MYLSRGFARITGIVGTVLPTNVRGILGGPSSIKIHAVLVPGITCRLIRTAVRMAPAQPFWPPVDETESQVGKVPAQRPLVVRNGLMMVAETGHPESVLPAVHQDARLAPRHAGCGVLGKDVSESQL